jgi:hypothetical protein
VLIRGLIKVVHVRDIDGIRGSRHIVLLIHNLLISAVHGSKWLDLRSARFIPAEEGRGTH